MMLIRVITQLVGLVSWINSSLSGVYVSTCIMSQTSKCQVLGHLSVELKLFFYVQEMCQFVEVDSE